MNYVMVDGRGHRTTATSVVFVEAIWGRHRLGRKFGGLNATVCKQLVIDHPTCRISQTGKVIRSIQSWSESDCEDCLA